MRNYLQGSIEAFRRMMEDEALLGRISDGVSLICEALEGNKQLLVCGNGGSAADAMHITGELVGQFHLDRRALNILCLNANPVVLTAWSNDISFESVFARQVEAHREEGSVLLGLTTSGNSANVVEAFKKAQALGMKTIGMTGGNGGQIRDFSDVLINVPAVSAPEVQNLHVPTYHWMCSEIEKRLAGA